MTFYMQVANLILQSTIYINFKLDKVTASIYNNTNK